MNIQLKSKEVSFSQLPLGDLFQYGGVPCLKIEEVVCMPNNECNAVDLEDLTLFYVTSSIIVRPLNGTFIEE